MSQFVSPIRPIVFLDPRIKHKTCSHCSNWTHFFLPLNRSPVSEPIAEQKVEKENAITVPPSVTAHAAQPRVKPGGEVSFLEKAKKSKKIKHYDTRRTLQSKEPWRAKLPNMIKLNVPILPAYNVRNGRLSQRKRIYCTGCHHYGHVVQFCRLANVM